jgi:hypothetical protein
MSPERLERDLRALPVAWPPTPDVADAVVARLQAEPDRAAPVRVAWWRTKRAWRAALAALAAALALTAAIEPARSAVLDWLGFGAVTVERGEPDAPVRPLGAGLDLGDPTTLDRARAAVPFPVRVPAALGEPDQVFLDTALGHPIVWFAYRPRPGLPRAGETGVGLLVAQLEGRAEPLVEKTAGAGTTLTRLRVDGDPAMWLAGAPHGFAYVPPTGEARFDDRERLAADVLLVDRRDGVLLRLEGDLDRATATRIAASLR